jgi:hypothetical protein
MATANEAENLKKQIEELAGLLGKNLTKELAAAAGDVDKLTELLKGLNKQFKDTVSNADSIYRSLQETTAELRKQNNLLNIGKTSYSKLTNIARDLSSVQDGSLSVTLKQTAKYQDQIKQKEKELTFLKDRLLTEQKYQNQINNFEAQRNAAQDRNQNELVKYYNRRISENERLIELGKSINNTVNDLIPSLKRELEVSEQIVKTRSDLGGIATNTAKLFKQYLGPLSSYFNMDEAIQEVDEYSKKVIDNAFLVKEVQEELLKNLEERQKLEEKIAAASTDAERKAFQEKLNELLEKDTKYRKQIISDTATLTNKFATLGIMMKNMGAGLLKGLTDPLTIITFFVSAALKANKEMVSMGKAMGYGVEKMNQMRERFVGIESSSSNINVNTSNLFEAQSQLNDSLGLAVEFTSDQLETQIMLTKQYGLSGDEAAGITRYAMLNNKSSKEMLDSINKSVVANRNQLKIGVNVNAVIREAAKVTGQLAANLGNNPVQIAAAIVKAKALGFELNQMKNISEGLLDFESSIGNELEAQLMTGMDLNLDRARLLALQGDYAGVGEEIVKQGVTMEKFSRMNVLQQQSLAKSLGMSTDELSDQLQKRKLAEESGKTLKQLQEEETAEANRRQAIQDKFAAAMEKLQSIVGNLVAGPFGNLLDGLVKGLEVLTEYGGAIKIMVVGMTGLYALSKAIWAIDQLRMLNQIRLNGWKITEGLIGKKNLAISIADAVAKISGMSAISMGVAAAIALAAGAAAYTMLSSKKGDDVMSEGGYGKRTLLAPEGAIKLNDKDTVIAGTNLGGRSKDNISPNLNKTQGLSPSINIGNIESILTQTLEQIKLINISNVENILTQILGSVEKLGTKNIETPINIPTPQLNVSLNDGILNQMLEQDKLMVSGIKNLEKLTTTSVLMQALNPFGMLAGNANMMKTLMDNKESKVTSNISKDEKINSQPIPTQPKPQNTTDTNELKAEIARLSNIVDNKLSALISAQSKPKQLVTHDGYVGWKLHGESATSIQ